MTQPASKTQKLFRKTYKGVKIPKLQDPELAISKGEVDGSTVLYIKHKKETGRLMIYLVGGGMLKYPKPSQAKEVMNLAKECGIDVFLPYYPLVFEGCTLPDVYEMLYDLYKEALEKYSPGDICFAGGSSGGNLALGLVSYINDKKEGVPVYMKHLQLGDFSGLKRVYLSFGGDEVFLAGAESIKKRLEEFGVDVTLEIGDGMYHSYAMMPLVKDAEDGYRKFKKYIAS